MKAGQFHALTQTRLDDLAVLLDAVSTHESVGHAVAVRFHGMALAVMVIPNVFDLEVGHAAVVCHGLV